MTGPLIHLNGTSGEDLEAQVRRVVETFNAALNALYLAAPNARDYYPLGEDAFAVARRSHEEHVAALTAGHRRYQDILESIIDQIEERATR